MPWRERRDGVARAPLEYDGLVREGGPSKRHGEWVTQEWGEAEWVNQDRVGERKHEWGETQGWGTRCGDPSLETRGRLTPTWSGVRRNEGTGQVMLGMEDIGIIIRLVCGLGVHAFTHACNRDWETVT